MPPYEPRLSIRQLDWRDLLTACRGVLANAQSAGSLDELDRYMIRLAYQQFPDFYGDSDTLARTHLLFNTCAKAVEMQRGFNIDDAFSDTTGLTLDKTWDITIAIYGLILNEGGIHPGPITAGNLKSNITDDDIQRYTKLVCLTPNEFKEKLNLPEYNVDPYETFNPNPLVNWPMLELEKHSWVVPVAPYLFRRGTEQIFYDVIKDSGRQFAGFFGYVFEDYVDRLLTILGIDYEIIRETRYLNSGQTYDTCDRIIIKDGDAILLECKTKRLSLRSKFTADKEMIRNDISDVIIPGATGNIVHAIRQLHRTENDIRANCQGLEDLNGKITGNVYPLVLVLDPYFLSNAPYFKNIISEELKKGICPYSEYSWQILDVREFELLCSVSSHTDLISLVSMKFSSPDLQAQDMSTFLGNYINDKGLNRDTIHHPVLSAELDNFWNNIAVRYGIKNMR